MDWIKEIENRLNAIFSEAGNEDLFLVDLAFNASNKKLEVFLDCDNGLSIGRCAKINRNLQELIDSQQWLGEKYILEVSSPGVGKPLKIIRQYKNNIGRRLEVWKTEGKPLAGELVEVKDDSILIKYEKGKKKKKESFEEVIPFDEIKRAIVKVSF